MTNTAPKDNGHSLSLVQQRELLAIARKSIAHALQHGQAIAVNHLLFDEPLRTRRATFVTIERRGELRGCIGRLDATRPLVVDVAHNAFAAAFQDPRFPPVSSHEQDQLDLHISILSSPQPMRFSDERDLLQQIRPGIDGLILELNDPRRPARGTFLPSVWEQLPDPATFLKHLKIKAGLTAEFWSDRITVSRYTAESVCEKNDVILPG